jgi:hypothetical protein
MKTEIIDTGTVGRQILNSNLDGVSHCTTLENADRSIDRPNARLTRYGSLENETYHPYSSVPGCFKIRKLDLLSSDAEGREIVARWTSEL